MMISKKEFKSQISRISVLFMREITKEILREMYEIFKDKEFKPFEQAISDIIRSEDRWPSPNIIQVYYDANVPDKELFKLPIKEDLQKAAKTDKHKYYLRLIEDLYDEKIDIEDSGIQDCLKEQGPNRVFTHYDSAKRIFVKA